MFTRVLAGLVLFVAIAAGTLVASPALAAPGHDGGCGQGQGASQGCEPDNGSECGNGQHSGNPHCDGDEATPTPTVEPTVTPTVEPTVAPTPSVTPTPEITPEDQPREDDPIAVSTPTPVAHLVPVVSTVVDVVNEPAPFGPVIFGNYPQPVFEPEFDLSTIKGLPHAGDGSTQNQGTNRAPFFFGLVAGLAVLVLGREIARR